MPGHDTVSGTEQDPIDLTQPSVRPRLVRSRRVTSTTTTVRDQISTAVRDDSRSMPTAMAASNPRLARVSDAKEVGMSL